MEFALVLRELWRRKRFLALGALVAAIAALASVYRLDGVGIKPRSLSFSSATTQVLVDSRQSALADLGQDISPLMARATVYANIMASPEFLDLVGARVGLAGNQIYAAGPVDPQLPRTVQEPTALKRNVELTGETTPYRLNFNSDPNLPDVGVFAQAPTTKMAIALANAAVGALQDYVANIESTTGVPPHSRAAIRQLGTAYGAVVNGGVSKTIFALVFIAVMLIWCVVMLAIARFRVTWRASATLHSAFAGAPGYGAGPPSYASPHAGSQSAATVANGAVSGALHR